MSVLDRVRYFRPGSIADAVARLGEPGAVALAGGTDLINGIRLGTRPASSVVDLSAVPELRVLGAGDPVSIGAGVTIRAFRAHHDLAGRYPAIADAAALLGGRQIQAMATFGGNLCNASPAAEMATPLLALGATARIAGPDGERTIPLERFWSGPGRTTLSAGELLVAVDLPVGLDGSASAYRRLELRRSVDIALVAASCWVLVESGSITAARVALGAVAPTPALSEGAAAMLLGAAIDDRPRLDAAVAAAARAAADDARPIDDHRASADYRRAMTEQLTARAIRSALTSRLTTEESR